MKPEEKIIQLLERYKQLVAKLDTINDQLNEAKEDGDGEDMIPGHDEGAEYFSRMIKYQAVVEQIQLIKKHLKNLGYKKGI